MTAGAWRSITRLIPCRLGSLALLAAHLEEENTDNKRVGEIGQPLLATHLGEGNSDFKSMT